MKEKWEIFKATLTEEKTMTKKEFLLITAVCVLAGLVTGMLISPRKYVTVGSHNGNNNRYRNDSKHKSVGEGIEDEEYEEEDIVRF